MQFLRIIKTKKKKSWLSLVAVDHNDFLTGKVSLALLTSSFFGPFIAQSCLSALKRISIWQPRDHIDPAFGWPKWVKDGAICSAFRKLLLGGGGYVVGGLVAESSSTFSQGTVFVLICRDASPWPKQVWFVTFRSKGSFSARYIGLTWLSTLCFEFQSGRPVSTMCYGNRWPRDYLIQLSSNTDGRMFN